MCQTGRIRVLVVPEASRCRVTNHGPHEDAHGFGAFQPTSDSGRLEMTSGAPIVFLLKTMRQAFPRDTRVQIQPHFVFIQELLWTLEEELILTSSVAIGFNLRKLESIVVNLLRHHFRLRGRERLLQVALKVCFVTQERWSSRICANDQQLVPILALFDSLCRDLRCHWQRNVQHIDGSGLFLALAHFRLIYFRM